MPESHKNSFAFSGEVLWDFHNGHWNQSFVWENWVEVLGLFYKNCRRRLLFTVACRSLVHFLKFEGFLSSSYCLCFSYCPVMTSKGSFEAFLWVIRHMLLFYNAVLRFAFASLWSNREYSYLLKGAKLLP